MNPYVAFPFVTVSGDARERGRQYGAQAADQVAASAETYHTSLAHLDLDKQVVTDLANDFFGVMHEYDVGHAEEMIGISEGSGVPLEDVVTINARTELVALARGTKDALRDECTAAVVLPESSATGTLFHGQNWDGGLERVEHCVVLRIEREDGPNVLTFTEAGALVRNGLNEAGIAVTGNNIECDRDFRHSGVPLPAIRRKALETPYYALAIKAIYSTQKAGSSNMMVSQCDGDAIDVECAPDESFLLYPEHGLLTHANHWENMAALAKLRDIGATGESGMAASPCSPYRARRIRRLLNDRNGSLTIDDMRSSFLDDWQSPYSVCRPPRERAGGRFTPCTAATVIMTPAEGTMEVARVPARDTRFTRYYIDGSAPEEVKQSTALQVDGSVS